MSEGEILFQWTGSVSRKVSDDAKGFTIPEGSSVKYWITNLPPAKPVDERVPGAKVGGRAECPSEGWAGTILHISVSCDVVVRPDGWPEDKWVAMDAAMFRYPEGD